MTRNTRRRIATRAIGLAISASAAISLTACFGVPGAGGDSSAVDFDGVQSATIQIEAVGTFVSPSEGGYEAAGRGSGFIISEDGLAVTNNHVVTGAGTIKVWRGGDTSETLNAKVLAASECLDLAVIQLEDGKYPHFGWHEGKITTATDVYAAGFPLGDPEFTMTRGIVSKADTKMDTPWASLDHVIEHDARIRGGNSGGPLIDADGRLMGVNYAGNDQHDTNLAIHRDEVEKAVKQLAKGKSVLSLGVNGTALTSDDGEGLGIWVNSIASGSSADKAGIEAGDLITKMEGVSVGTDGTMADYCDVLQTHGQEATISVELYRPADGIYYSGQFNGEEVKGVSVVQSAGADTPSSGDTAPSSPSDFASVVDDTQSVAVEVPNAWNQIDGSVYTDPNGGEWARIEASTNLQAYSSGWSVPGVSVLASPTGQAAISPDQWLALVTPYLQQSGCSLAAHDAYSDGLHSGVFDYWTGCGDSKADYLMLSALADDGSYVITLSVTALTDVDLNAIDRALGSFVAQF